MIGLPTAPASFADAPESHGKIELESHDSIEVAGHAFFENYENHTKVDIVVEEAEEDESSVSSGSRTPGGGSTPGHSKKSKTRAGMLKLDDALKGVNIYEFMEVDDEFDDKSLKKAFQKASLKWHPDKTIKDLGEEKANAKYVALQEAYEILKDPVKRRKYDSAQPFDDDMPKEKDLESVIELREAGEHADADKEFYDLFYPVFKRNAKWSIKQPVPELPKEDDLESAQKFYKFWLTFDSWRDFDLKIIEEEGEDTLDNPEKADCREERRYMETKNARIRQKYRNNESSRIMKLTELAEKFDSRIIKFNNEKWERKNAGKVKKQKEAEEKARKEKEAAEAAEKAKAEEEERKAKEKAAKEDKKQVLKNTRRDIRNISKIALQVDQDQMQEMLTEKMSSVEELSAFLEELHPKSSDKNAVTALIFEKMTGFGMNPIKHDEATVLADRKKAEELEAQRQAEKEEAEAAAEAKKNNKKGKKKNNKKKKGGNDDDDEDEIDDVQRQAEAAESRMDRDANKKKNDMKKQKDLEKKKAQEAAKAERDKKDAEKEAAKKAKAEEEKKAKAEAAKAKIEEDRKRKAAEAEAKKKAAKVEQLSIQFCVIRKRQFEFMDEEVKTDVKAYLDDNLPKGVKCAIHQIAKKGNESDEELRIDMAAALCAATADGDFKWVEIGRRPADLQNELDTAELSKGKLKKNKQRIREALKSYIDTESKGDVPADLLKIIGEFPELPTESWEIEVEQAASSAAGAADGEGSKKKKKKKAAGKQDEEDDFEAALAEFGCDAPTKKKKNKK